MPRVVAVLLAAGESSRMGRPKPLLPWAGTTLVEWQIGQLREAGVDEVVVVLGSRAAEVAPYAAAAGARPVPNPTYREGRASSVRTGAAAVADDPAWIAVLSVDQPRPAWVASRLLEAARPGATIVSPVYEGRGGHPLILAGRLLPEMRRVREESFGLREITQTHEADTVRVGFTNSCVIVDLNTPAEYESALKAFERGDWHEDSDQLLQNGKEA